MMKYIDATHNMWFRLQTTPNKWKEDLAVSGQADIVGYSEADGDKQRAVLAAFCADTDRGLYHPQHSDSAISWKTDVFRQVRIEGVPVHGRIVSHASAIAMGINRKYNPGRDFTWVGLLHRDTRQRILRINVHPLAGGTKPESRSTDGPELSEYKDWGIGQYWLDVVSFAAGQMSMQRGEKITDDRSLWDIVSLGGDYNAELDRAERWYYPGALLPALFEPDAMVNGLDHLQVSHGSDARPVRRWAVNAHTDHRLHFVEREIREREDFPGQ